MRVSDARFNRDLRSFNLAVRMLSHQGRTRTVSAWTGLSADRVRKLASLYRRESPQVVTPRPPGPSPCQLVNLLTTPSLKTEAATAAGVCRMLKILPAEPVANGQLRLPDIARGELLCTALELFQDFVPHARLTFDQLVMLLNNLTAGEEWAIARCTGCPALVVADRLALKRPLCEECEHKSRTAKKAVVSKPNRLQAAKPSVPAQPDIAQPEGGVQLSLFEEASKGSR